MVNKGLTFLYWLGHQKLMRTLEILHTTSTSKGRRRIKRKLHCAGMTIVQCQIMLILKIHRWILTTTKINSWIQSGLPSDQDEDPIWQNQEDTTSGCAKQEVPSRRQRHIRSTEGPSRADPASFYFVCFIFFFYFLDLSWFMQLGLVILCWDVFISTILRLVLGLSLFLYVDVMPLFES